MRDRLAVWEIKQYHDTAAFGSRVAEGVYGTLLDGMELEELDAEYRELAMRKVQCPWHSRPADG